MKPKQQKEYENCDLCKKSEEHSHCTECGKLLSPINKCKCPERQGGNWIPKQQEEKWEEEFDEICEEKRVNYLAIVPLFQFIKDQKQQNEKQIRMERKCPYSNSRWL